jgi:hypothetical protein
MELSEFIHATLIRSKGMRQFMSGIVGIAKGQTARLNVVNTAAPGSPPKVIFTGVWQKPPLGNRGAINL